MKNLNGMKIAVSQMKVVPGRPDLNTEYIISEIKKAEIGGVDNIVFPEMAVPGYLIGDLYEDEAFVRDVEKCNEEIINSTRKTAVIFGSIKIDNSEMNEDGRLRKYNSAIVAQNGKMTGFAIKTLQPNYRIFDDDRHFYSRRKIQESLESQLQPLMIETKIGDRRVGVILCEDMWHDDYPYSPTEILVKNGAELIVNVSCSPWTWQKNRKRHQVVKDLIEKTKAPFVYVNNTGIQNNGKNVIVFDGSSTIYNDKGERIYAVEPYFAGTKVFEFKVENPVLENDSRSDVEELYLALTTAARSFIDMLPEEMRKVVIGLSGGIDSALSAAIYTHILGPEKVLCINMPSKFNSSTTKDIAKSIAQKLGTEYLVIPIQEAVDVLAKKAGAKEGTVAYENIQARTRMEVLATKAQTEGCVYSANWNKIEAAFGYGTLYGDMAGFLAVLGDLTKYEVYQLAKFFNDEVYKDEVIPKVCFDQAPSAELRTNQRDPFDYGRLNERGYHDEMVRAFTEFRLNPEWFLEKYLADELESALRLNPGKLNELFPTKKEFIDDLEKNWKRFLGSYFKRIQGPPIPIVSKRAFGYDLRESILPVHFTKRYYELKNNLLALD